MTDTTIADEATAAQITGPYGAPPGRRRWWRWVALALVAVVGAGIFVAVDNPFAGPSKTASGVVDNSYPTSLATVDRQTLSSQTEVSGTLGFGGSTDVILPAGTASSTLAQAEQQVSSARQALAADEQALASTGASNADSLAQSEQQLASARATLASDRAAAAGSGQSGAISVAQAEQQVATAELTLSQDRASVKATQQSNAQALAQAEQQVASAQATLASDRTAAASSARSGSISVAQAEQTLATARAALASDQSTLASDRATLSAAEQKEAADCAGDGAQPPPTGSGGVSSPCSADTSLVASDHQAVTTDISKVATDQAAVKSARQGVTSARAQSAQTVQQAQATVAADQSAVKAAEQSVAATQTSDAKATQQAQAKVAADQAAVKSAQQGVASARAQGGQSTQQAQAKVAADQSAVKAAEQSVAATQTANLKATQQAQAQVAAARLALSQDLANLATDQANAAVSGQSFTYSAVPGAGHVVRRGQQLFAIGGVPVLLLYGTVAPTRAFMPGIPPGADVGELNANLEALGYGHGLQGDVFTASTQSAVRALQRAHGMAPTGELPLGSVIFEPGALRVSAVSVKVNETVAAGQPVLQATALSRQVTIALDASQQSEVKVGDRVSIVMPDNSTTPGVVSSVGSVASAGSSGSSPTVTVQVTPTDPAATGNLDSAPVNVWITEATVPNALVVPVDALVALANGGYALEAIGRAGAHYLVGVSLGLFDDADGLVQVSGSGLHAGLRVVVPGI